MPSVEDMCILPENTKTTQDFLARDMEELVSEIKENLRLSGLEVRHTRRNTRCRQSPYTVPSHSWSNNSSWGHSKSQTSFTSTEMSKCRKTWDDVFNPLTTSEQRRLKNSSKSSSSSTDNPYEMLRALQKEGSLIKEAVRRLQLDLAPK